MPTHNTLTVASDSVTHIDYLAAIAEFDQLWVSIPTPNAQARIDALALIIHAYEAQPPEDTVTHAASIAA